MAEAVVGPGIPGSRDPGIPRSRDLETSRDSRASAKLDKGQLAEWMLIALGAGEHFIRVIRARLRARIASPNARNKLADIGKARRECLKTRPKADLKDRHPGDQVQVMVHHTLLSLQVL